MDERRSMIAAATLAATAGMARRRSAAATCSSAASAAPPVPPLIREGVTEKITAHVHVIPDNSVPMVPNVGIVVGSRATLVIDTGLGARNGAAVMREVAKVSRNTELYLVTTHVHPEHDLGAGAFPATTKMIRSKDQVDESRPPASRWRSASPASRRSTPSCCRARVPQGGHHLREGAHARPRRRHGAVPGDGLQPHARRHGHLRRAGQGALLRRRRHEAAAGGGRRRHLVAVDREPGRLAALAPARVVPSHGAMGDASIMATRSASSAPSSSARPN